MQGKKEGKDRESIQSSSTSDQGYHGNVTHTQLNVANENQEVSHFPAGDHKASIYRRMRKNVDQDT